VAEPPSSDIRSKLDRLAAATWGTREEIARTPLILRPSPNGDCAAIVDEMLRHARRVAPRLNVPRLAPRVVVAPLAWAAGEFAEEDGWVKINLGAGFFNDPLAAHAILCHELCHYVLNASGIREPTRVENERLTDAAMFVLGLGDIFLAGYRRAPTEYRAGHRLGYLSDAEYQFAAAYVGRLRASLNRFASPEEELERRLRGIVSDGAARARLVAGYRRKYPSAAAAELAQRIIDDITRDNR
jgi:hypothetical protein